MAAERMPRPFRCPRLITLSGLNDNKYYIERTNHMGLGLFARREYKAGSVIWQDPAIASLPHNELTAASPELVLTQSCLSTGHDFDWFNANNYNQIKPPSPRLYAHSEATRRAIRETHKVSENVLTTLWSVVSAYTAPVQSPLEMRSHGHAVYHKASFLNHSCRPNAVRCNTAKDTVLYALKDIKAGEEITVPYVPFETMSIFIRGGILRQLFVETRCACRTCLVEMRLHLAKNAEGQKKDVEVGEIQNKHMGVIGPLYDADTPALMVKTTLDCGKDSSLPLACQHFTLSMAMYKLRERGLTNVAADMKLPCHELCSSLLPIIRSFIARDRGDHVLFLLRLRYTAVALLEALRAHAVERKQSTADLDREIAAEKQHCFLREEHIDPAQCNKAWDEDQELCATEHKGKLQ